MLKVLRNHCTNGSTREPVLARAAQCPRIAREFLEAERRSLGPRWYAQEYEYEFTKSLDQMFIIESIDAIFAPDDSPLPVLSGV